MGQETAKSMQEMNTMNRRFWNRAKTAQTRILKRLAKRNIQKSREIVKEGLIEYSGGGILFSSIALQPINQIKVNVIALDYGEGGEKDAEIEYGLKTKEFRKYADYPKLKGWVLDKWGHTPKGGILVGNSPAGIPHPKGLHYFELGFKTSFAESDMIITEELNKLGC